MKDSPDSQEAIERARAVMDTRLETIRHLVDARQNRVDVKTTTDQELAELQASISHRIADAEKADLDAYNAAKSAGWTPEELRKIGFADPTKKPRTRRRSTRRPANKTSPNSGDNQNDRNDEQPQDDHQVS